MLLQEPLIGHRAYLSLHFFCSASAPGAVAALHKNRLTERCRQTTALRNIVKSRRSRTRQSAEPWIVSQPWECSRTSVHLRF
jgi:hypothetical protein